MPVRRRSNRRRGDDFKAWAGYLECGFDFFGELPSIGRKEHPPLVAARAAWLRFAPELIERWQTSRVGIPHLPWAIEEFGLPKGLTYSCPGVAAGRN
jgi:hypothetical protein